MRAVIETRFERGGGLAINDRHVTAKLAQKKAVPTPTAPAHHCVHLYLVFGAAGQLLRAPAWVVLQFSCAPPSGSRPCGRTIMITIISAPNARRRSTLRSRNTSGSGEAEVDGR